VPLPDLDHAPPGTIDVPAPEAPGALRALVGMGSCYWTASLLIGAVAFVAIAIPTAVIPNPVFGRLVATRWWDPILLAVSSVLLGMVWAARRGADAGPGDAAPLDPEVVQGHRRSAVGGLLTFLAVGCPTCNKLVLVALGTSGALTWFAPIQPVLGLAGIVVLAVTLRGRLRSVGPLRCSA
jgi:hypothetical protein